MKHYLLERGAFTFPLDNLTRAFTASFPRYISTLGGFGGPERTEKCSSIRADVYLVGSLASAVAPCSSSSGPGSGLLRANWTFVGTPLGYLYLYPYAHSMMVCQLAPNFFWS